MKVHPALEICSSTTTGTQCSSLQAVPAFKTGPLKWPDYMTKWKCSRNRSVYILTPGLAPMGRVYTDIGTERHRRGSLPSEFSRQNNSRRLQFSFLPGGWPCPWVNRKFSGLKALAGIPGGQREGCHHGNQTILLERC